MKKCVLIVSGVCVSIAVLCFVFFDYSKKESDAQRLGAVSVFPQLDAYERKNPVPIEEITEPETNIDSVPYHIRLNVPQSVQETSYYCGCAAAQMVLRYHGNEISQDDLAKELHTHPITGTEYADLARVLNHHLFGKEELTAIDPGYRVHTLAVNDDSDIALTFESRVKQDLASNDPVIVAVDVQALYPELNRGNHFVVVIGYRCNEQSERIAVYDILDPSYVVQDAVYGGWKTVPADELMQAIVSNVEPAYIW